jgi:voltage-gated potassium channel
MPFFQAIEADVEEQRQVRDAYGVALLFVMLSVLTLIAFGPRASVLLILTSAALQLGALVITLKVSGFSARSWTIGSIVIIALFAAGVLSYALGDRPGHLLGLLLWILLTLVTIATIIRRIGSYERITIQLLMGLLVVYLLVGVTFGLCYCTIELVTGNAFAQGMQGVSGSVYFSFITMATVGFGDVSPGNDIVRALAVAEAIAGQLYLVSVVSVAVSRLGARRSRPNSKESE